jgi:dTDP-4-amino-4,6-dideoxygalactose transaminase
LQHLDKWQKRRKLIADYFTEELTKLNVTVRPTPNYNSVTSNHKFAIFVNDKVEFRNKIKEHGVECRVHYTNNFARSSLISDNPRDMYFTDKYVQHALTIPSSPWLTDAECETVIEKIKQVINKNDQGVIING